MREGDTLRIARLRKALSNARGMVHAIESTGVPALAAHMLASLEADLVAALQKDDPREAL
jgi:hypothetical protein